MTDTRLIERWLPIAALGEESVRERRSMTALPPIYYLHVWWARRPLVASRAAVLASVLPADADHEHFMHALGIHGDPVMTRKRLDQANKTGDDLGANPYGYERAFKYCISSDDHNWLKSSLATDDLSKIVILDPTAGGGSIPFEAERLGFSVRANDLNPVAGLILTATIEAPIKHGRGVLTEFNRLASEFIRLALPKYEGIFPPELPGTQIIGYLWARTIGCPYCDGVVPLSPNWRLAPDGIGVRLVPNLANGPGTAGRRCEFEIVRSLEQQSPGTVADGDGICPFRDCGRVIDGDEIKRQAQAGRMGDQLYAVVFKRLIETRIKSGKRGRGKWQRGYRAPRREDDNIGMIQPRLSEKLHEWEALDIVPTERFPENGSDTRPIQYGMPLWRDLFSPRQLLCHGISVEIFHELLQRESMGGPLSELTRVSFVYLSLALDKLLNYNSRMSVWMPTREVIANTFNRHDFAFCWSHAEMAPLITGFRYDWAIEQTAKCIEELVELVRPAGSEMKDLLAQAGNSNSFIPSSINIACKPGDVLDHIANVSVDVVVIDPPYYNNVMYAELSDFFYVWLKRTAGHIVPEFFTRQLTDKENEAVANPAKFSGQRGAQALAERDYQERMQRIFEECRRVLKPDGVMTLMFTHKATGAWDALTKGLMEAGFTITASWPINTEAEGSLHIKNRSAANSTIFLVCRPRGKVEADSADYWEDPALEEFSRHWPLKRGTPRQKPERLRRRQQSELFEEEWNPYAVTPEDALDAARREVKRWRLEQLTHMKASDELDPLTSFFVLAWDAFRAPVFPYDEALRLARAVGVDLDRQVVGVLVEKKGSDLRLWDSGRRAAKGSLGPPDGTRGMIDALHHAAHLGRTRTLQAANEMLTKAGVDQEPMFFAALEAVLEVLPVGKAFSGIDLDGDLAAAGGDFEALENLRRLAFTERVDPPKQLELWLEPEPA